ncbi:hypothetical protein Tco_1377131 [Tanacetum coccineum]
MPPRRTRNINDVYERIMARMDERLDQFVDQFSNRMNDMMNLRRCGDRNGRRSEDEELGNPFFEGDCSSSNELGDHGVAGDDYEGAPVFDDGYEEAPIFDDDQFEEESMPVYDTDIEDVISEEEELPDGLSPLRDIQRHIDLESSSQFPDMREREELRRQVKDLVSKGHIRERMSPCAQPRRPFDLMSLYVFGSVPKKVHDFVEGLPYHGDSSANDLVGNSRTNFVYPWGNDAGPSVEERALLFLKAQDRVKEKA